MYWTSVSFILYFLFKYNNFINIDCHNSIFDSFIFIFIIIIIIILFPKK
jgi:hypothetical protein